MSSSGISNSEENGTNAQHSQEEIVLVAPVAQAASGQGDSRRRGRKFAFTLPNYTPDDVENILQCGGGATYVVAGREICPATGTPHLQCFVYFGAKKSWAQVKALLPNACHIEHCISSPAQNIKYCKKDMDFVESGIPPMTRKEQGVTGGEMEKARWRDIIDNRDDDAWLEENEPRVWAEGERVIESIRKRKAPTPTVLTELTNEWWHGPTGTGKSRLAAETYPDAFRKDPLTRWWDGYTGQDVVIIDDFDTYQKAQGGDMKRWMDHYPFQAAFKGSYRLIRPKKIIVTSNYKPSEIWDDQQTVDPIARRVTMREFAGPPVIPAMFAPQFNAAPVLQTPAVAVRTRQEEAEAIQREAEARPVEIGLAGMESPPPPPGGRRVRRRVVESDDEEDLGSLSMFTPGASQAWCVPGSAASDMQTVIDAQVEELD